MELRHLRYFVAVADTLNFTKAAAALHLAQPSLTRQIQNLEEEIGVRLLDRSKKHVALTEEGRAFLVDAQRLLALATESIQSVQRLSRGETGQLNIGYLSNFNFDLLPRTLAAFRQDHPHVALNLFDMTPAEQFRALEARKIDLGFVGLRFPSASDALQWECLARHKTVVALPIKHPLARQRSVNLRDLKGMFFVGMSEKTHPGFRDWLAQTCQPAGFTPKILQDAELEPGLMRFVAEGLGVTLAREQIKNIPHSGVVFRPLAPPVKAEYWIARNRDNASSALRDYVQIVKTFSGSII
jgi:DNA-binding transcriptional LysR family regulator